MCPYWLLSVLLLWETTAVVGTTADEQWALRFALHQTLETALLNNPSNLFKLSEVFFPRRYAISPVSVRVTYNLMCQEFGNCSLQTKDVDNNGNYTFSFAWSSLPINRIDRITFCILESLSQQFLGMNSPPLVELSLEIESLPNGASRQDVEDEFLGISAMLKAYAKEQGIPPPNSKYRGYASSTVQIDYLRIAEDLYSKLLCTSHILADCSLFLTFLSMGYLIYGIVYEKARCKKNPAYGFYWATVFFSIDLFIVTVAYFKTNAIMGPQLIIFLILEFIVSIVIVCKSKHPDFPIPLVPTTFSAEYEKRIERMNKFTKCAITALLYTVQVLALWFPVAVLHAFAYNIVDRVEVLMTFPLESFVEFVLYLIPAICFFAVLNLPFYNFYNEERQCFTRQEKILKICFVVIKVLNTLIAAVVIWIVGISTHSLALIFSWSRDSEARLLVTVLLPILLTFVMAKAVWRIIKKNQATETDPTTKNVKTIMRPGNQGAGETKSQERELGCQEPGELGRQVDKKPGSQGAPAVNIDHAKEWLLTSTDT